MDLESSISRAAALAELTTDLVYLVYQVRRPSLVNLNVRAQSRHLVVLNPDIIRHFQGQCCPILRVGNLGEDARPKMQNSKSD